MCRGLDKEITTLFVCRNLNAALKPERIKRVGIEVAIINRDTDPQINATIVDRKKIGNPAAPFRIIEW